MNPLRARVEKGRLVLDEPTTLPEGTVLDLVVDDDGDDLSERDRDALRAALDRSARSLNEGRVQTASAIVDQLRTRR